MQYIQAFTKWMAQIIAWMSNTKIIDNISLLQLSLGAVVLGIVASMVKFQITSWHGSSSGIGSTYDKGRSKK